MHAAILKHLEQLIHLDGMQLANFIQKQHAAVRLCHRAGLGLRNALHPQTARALIDGIVHAAKQRISNGALIKAHAGRVHFDKGRVFLKGRTGTVLGVLQHQPRRTGFTNARRAVDNHVLGIGAAQDGLQGLDALLLADNILKALRAHMLAERLAQMYRAHLAQMLHLA